MSLVGEEGGLVEAEAANLESTLSGIDKLLLDMATEENTVREGHGRSA
jgi:hypothetical protein